MNDRDPGALLETSSGFVASGIVGLVVAVVVLGVVAALVSRRFGRRGSLRATLVLFAVAVPAGPVAVGAVAALVAGFVVAYQFPDRRTQTEATKST